MWREKKSNQNSEYLKYAQTAGYIFFAQNSGCNDNRVVQTETQKGSDSGRSILHLIRVCFGGEGEDSGVSFLPQKTSIKTT